MSQVARLVTSEAKSNPERFFSLPGDLVDEVMLTRGEKLATLERWRMHVLQELAAASEGMQTHGVGRQAQLLDEIETARLRLSSR
ncbi:MAG: hypothetical protein Q7T86_13845 [Hyphomicrobiaceae bacterium]|nr:hypothetical protein [Hyphomicrobiaceae bacterium]